jgi:hypothetical protein
MTFPYMHRMYSDRVLKEYCWLEIWRRKISGWMLKIFRMQK